jgi:hypothetical protein
VLALGHALSKKHVERPDLGPRSRRPARGPFGPRAARSFGPPRRARALHARGVARSLARAWSAAARAPTTKEVPGKPAAAGPRAPCAHAIANSDRYPRRPPQRPSFLPGRALLPPRPSTEPHRLVPGDPPAGRALRRLLYSPPSSRAARRAEPRAGQVGRRRSHARGPLGPGGHARRQRARR